MYIQRQAAYSRTKPCQTDLFHPLASGELCTPTSPTRPTAHLSAIQFTSCCPSCPAMTQSGLRCLAKQSHGGKSKVSPAQPNIGVLLLTSVQQPAVARKRVCASSSAPGTFASPAPPIASPVDLVLCRVGMSANGTRRNDAFHGHNELCAKVVNLAYHRRLGYVCLFACIR